MKISKNYTIITLLLIFSNILQSSAPKGNIIANNKSIIELFELINIETKLNQDTEKLTLEDVQRMKNELNNITTPFLQGIFTNTKLDKNIRSELTELQQNRIKKIQENLELLSKSLGSVEFYNF